MICHRTSRRRHVGIVPSALPLDGFSPEHQAWIRTFMDERDRRICFLLDNPPPQLHDIARDMADVMMEEEPGGRERLAACRAELATMPVHVRDRLVSRALEMAYAEGYDEFDGEAMQRELPNVPHVAEVFGILHHCMALAHITFFDLAISRIEVEYVLIVADVLTGR